MWEDDSARFARLHAISVSKAKLLRSTAEHLTARQEGGRDSSQNIVAACLYCNGKQHLTKQPKSSAGYTLKVRRRLTEGKWHGIKLVPIF